MKITKILSLSIAITILALLVLSCAEMKPPTPYQILKHPLGTTSLKKGMAKEEVVELWGQPNKVNALEKERWAEPKEEWIYYARYPAVPVDYNYLSKTKYLYFEGNILIDWKSEDKKEQ